jgi:isomerase DpgB
MNAPSGWPAPIAGGGLRLVMNTAQALPELTAALDRTCAMAEDDGHPAVVISASPVMHETRDWPGTVLIAEVNRWERAVRRLERLRCPSILLAAGVCGGPSLDLLLATDYRIAATDMRLLLPVNDGHFWPGMAVHRLVNQVGGARARQMVLWGSELTAQHATAIGLVDQVAADLDTAVSAARILLGRQSGSDLAVRRQLLLEAYSSAYEDALGVHLAACDRELRRLHGPGTPGPPNDQPGTSSTEYP